MMQFINSARAGIVDLFHRIITLINKLWATPFLRFLVVGGINTIFGYVVFALFILLQLHYTLAALLAAICGTLFNFKTHGVITFRNKRNWLIFRFAVIAIINYFLNIGLLKIFELNNVGSLIAQAILILPLAFTSFLMMSKFVFNTNIEP